MLYWVHPLWQATAAVFALGALSLGWQRFRILHMGRKGGFAWKRHVLLGSIALIAWIFGAVFGLITVRLEWGVFFLTGAHGRTGLIFVVLAVFGYISGHVLDRTRNRRVGLPLLHGACNLLLVILAFVQAWTGWDYLF